MNTSSWRTEDGQLLRSLREEAGIDELVFARNNTVSLAQLKELEQGGDHSFYNPAIKRSTGVKLLKKLGHELPTPEPIQPAEAPSAAPAPTEPVSVAPFVMAPVHTSNSDEPALTARRSLVQQPVFWLLWLLSLIALAAFQPWASKAPLPTLTSSAGPEKTSPAVLESTNTAMPNQVSATAPMTDPSVAVAKELDTTVSSSCDWQHRDNSKTHTPSQPIKPGNYVYLEAQADTVLCVLDSQNKKTLLQLKAGMAKSVYGAAPFLVHSQDWQNFKLFFQGRRVHEALSDVKHLLLNSQPL